jgi:serine-type D-Ala-D-Ala carboxypeptidase (penicillin-binding protein 5/6)
MLAQSKRLFTAISRFILGFMLLSNAIANPISQPTHALTPPSPEVSASAYILMDAASGTVLASNNADTPIEPASLTKMMTMYVVSSYLHDNQLTLNDEVRISTKAWRTEGSKLFVKQGNKVPVSTLIKGIIIVSGNDASIAMAEHIAGSEKAFVSLMNSTAQQLGMTQTHFENVTGLPHKNHLTSAHDLAILAKALITHFPEEYSWYKEKWLNYNGIKQPNRNRLLWRDAKVDGIKTGHTQSAGYCLVGSAKNNDMRLITVVLGEPSDNARTDDSQSLLTWGFRFFESNPLLQSNKPIYQARAWMGKQTMVNMGVDHNIAVTTPKGQSENLQTDFTMNKNFRAPVQAGQAYGQVDIKDSQGKIIASYPMIALETVPKGSFITRIMDSIALFFHNLLA